MMETVNIPAPAMRDNKALLWFYLGPLMGGLSAALVMAAALGVVSALVAALVGPCVQVITAPRDEHMQFVALFGEWLGPIITRFYGESGISAGDLLKQLPWLLVVLALSKSVLGLAQWFLWERAGEIISLRLRDDLAGSYIGLAPSYRRDQTGRSMEEQLSSGITTDVKLMREYLVHFYGGLPREAFQVVFLAVMLVMLSPKLTAIFLLGVAPAAAVGSRIGRVLRRRAAKALADYSQLTEWLQQRLMGIETIKHYRTEGVEIAKMESLTTGLYERFLRAARVKARTSPLLEAFAVVAMVVVLIIALRDINAGRSTGAIELSFFSTLGLLSQAGAKLGRYLNANREGAAAVDRLRSLLGFLQAHAQAEVASAPRELAPQSRIICEQLTATYPGADKPALKNLSFSFEAGRIYCLAGPSGAGKSTLFNILLGLVTPIGGTLRFESAQPVIGAGLAYMPQKVILLPDSIAANVAYPEAADIARVEAALARVGLTELVAGLRGGVQTHVGEGGVGVSGGQAQRLLLARLWYQHQPFVLIDEGTSALDPEIERIIYGLLRQLADDGAVVVTIAHRLAAAEIADVLLLLNHGELVTSGAPRDVIASEAYRGILG